jgi:hypothetical protein
MTRQVARVLWLAGLVALGGCHKSSGPEVRVSLIQADDASTDGRRDAITDGPSEVASAAMCCVVPRVLTGLEQYDPNYSTPYHNVETNGTQQQKAQAACNQLSAWPGPPKIGDSPTQAQIDNYMKQFKSGPAVAVVMPCWDPPKQNSSYGRWQCGGDGGQAAWCSNNGLSCAEGSQCWFDPGGTYTLGCTGTVTKCSYVRH